MTLRASSGTQAASTEPETGPFPDGADLRRWTARRTRRHRRGVWALVGDIYSGLLTTAVVGMILAPYLRRLVITRSSAPSEGTGLPGSLDLDPGWLLLALMLLLLALGLGPLHRLGPLFLRPHEAAWWLPMPGDRGGLLVPVARTEYFIAAAIGAMTGVLPALLAGGGWVSTAVWPALLAAVLCLVLSGLITAQIRSAGVSRLRGTLILTGAAICVTGAVLPFPRPWPGCWALSACCGGDGYGSVWDSCMTPRFSTLSPDPSAPMSPCSPSTPGPWGACSRRHPPDPAAPPRFDGPGSPAGCPGLSGSWCAWLRRTGCCCVVSPGACFSWGPAWPSRFCPSCPSP